MNNDLISREALKVALHNEIGEHALTPAIDRVIDNAPTVKERSYEQGVIDGKDTEFDNGFEQGYAKGYENCEHDNERPQGELANDVWKLYEKYQSHLATRVIEFGDELKDLLGKYQKGGAE